ncbi:glycosyltransferase family 87 protein [Corynebacterium sp. 21KM1197]|uniref:glycosyltransferase family 87 protein n=1 Tax=Corynebacterium sp. 21KM1197 TaxID=2989734 RepID=UPI0029CAA63E|nr:glycosyltransferase family 87 protein [Corynebacterium sp. 21KM1197]WPF67711.1 glycosyltransferase family 87 protein [Corynebacterium sp. 21KM1197]
MFVLSRDRLSTTWVAFSPLTSERVNTPSHREPHLDRLLRPILWPLAVLSMLHLVCFPAAAGTETDDFTTVYRAVSRFLDGTVVYNEVYSHVDPHYLYNPGATLLLSPLGISSDLSTSRMVFIVANALAIISALGLLTRLFGHSLRGWLFPAAVLAASATEAVRSTLIFSNINGLLFLALVAFMALLLRNRLWWAGIVLGLAIVVKPFFAPLLLLPLVKAQWPTIIAATGLPVALNLAAWPLMNQPERYFTEVTPYLSQVRDYANASLSGQAVYFAMPGGLHAAAFLLIAACVVISVVVLLRWRYSDPLLWVVTTSTVLLAGVFLLSSLGQKYYSLLLIPLFFTATQARSVAHHWLTWVAAYLFLTPQPFVSDGWHREYVLTTLTAPLGWALLIFAVTGTVVGWWRYAERGTPPAPRPRRHRAHPEARPEHVEHAGRHNPRNKRRPRRVVPREQSSPTPQRRLHS